MLDDTATQEPVSIVPMNGLAVLAGKMARVMGTISRIKKAGVNVEQKWKYATIDDITDMIREAMADAGLGLFASMVECEVGPGQTTKGGTINRAKVKIAFELMCSETGASKVMTWTGTADDYSDKALNKAATYAEKFWLMRTFLVSTGDDPDADSPGDEKRGAQQNNRDKGHTQQQRQSAPLPAPSATPVYLTDENKRKLVAKGKLENKLEPQDGWKEFLKVARLNGDADCARFPSGKELYEHFEKMAETLKNPATTPPAEPDEKIIAVHRARHGEHIVFPEASVTWFKGRKELAKLVGDEFAVVMNVLEWAGTKKAELVYEFPALTLTLVKPHGKAFYDIVKAEPAIKPRKGPLAAAQPDSPAGEKQVAPDPNNIDAWLDGETEANRQPVTEDEIPF